MLFFLLFACFHPSFHHHGFREAAAKKLDKVSQTCKVSIRLWDRTTFHSMKLIVSCCRLMDDRTFKWLLASGRFALQTIFSQLVVAFPLFYSLLSGVESLNLVCYESFMNNYYLDVMNSTIQWLSRWGVKSLIESVRRVFIESSQVWRTVETLGCDKRVICKFVENCNAN